MDETMTKKINNFNYLDSTVVTDDDADKEREVGSSWMKELERDVSGTL